MKNLIVGVYIAVGTAIRQITKEGGLGMVKIATSTPICAANDPRGAIVWGSLKAAYAELKSAPVDADGRVDLGVSGRVLLACANVIDPSKKLNLHRAYARAAGLGGVNHLRTSDLLVPRRGGGGGVTAADIDALDSLLLNDAPAEDNDAEAASDNEAQE